MDTKETYVQPYGVLKWLRIISSIVIHWCLSWPNVNPTRSVFFYI